MRAPAILFAVLAMLCGAPAWAEGAVRLKDMGKFVGWRENALVGYGLVTGLAGSGDSPGNKATRQMLANALSQFDVSVTPDQVLSRNAAAVMVTATLPPVAKVGDVIDVTVTSAADARSLTGGTLMLTQLKAPNGKVYALAQGPVTVGGYRYDMNGSMVQKNHPTVGRVSAGATVEVAVDANILSQDNRLTFGLAAPDFTTAARVAAAVNAALGGSPARARDAEAIEIQVPAAERERLVDFVSRIERLAVQPDRRARVVVNERTGTVVSGGDVRLEKVVVSHGDLKVSIDTDNTVSQPAYLGRAGDEVRTALLSNSRITVKEKSEAGYVAADNTVAQLIHALVRMKVNPRDMVAILQALKTEGALHADLIVQ